MGTVSGDHQETGDVLISSEAINNLLQQYNEEISHDSCEDYFRNIFETIKDVQISDIPYDIIYKIAILVKSEWKDYAARLGINGYFELLVIETRAEINKQLPLCIALYGHLRNGTFGRIIEVLVEKHRLDILNHIRSSVQDFVKEKNGNKCFATLDKKEDLPSLQEIFQTDIFNKKAALPKNITEQLKNVRFSYCTTSSKKYPSKEKLVDTERIENISLKSLPLHAPQQNKESSLSVFIPHTVLDTEVAIKLAHILSMSDMQVTCEHDVEYLMAIDDCGVINTILHKVDFVVPILSPSFLECIRPSKNIGKQPRESTNNRFIFQWLQTEYKNNDSMNFRVRPVITEEIKEYTIRQELLFKCYWKLWGEIPTLVDILKRTKHLLNFSDIPFY